MAAYKSSPEFANYQKEKADFKAGGGKRAAASERKPKAPTAYTLYVKDVRANFKAENPKMDFGELSRLIGSKWKALSAEEKSVIKTFTLLQLNFFFCRLFRSMKRKPQPLLQDYLLQPQPRNRLQQLLQLKRNLKRRKNLRKKKKSLRKKKRWKTRKKMKRKMTNNS